MKTHLNPPIIWNFVIVMLLGGLSVILVPSSDAFGQQRISERECQGKLDRGMKARKLRPDVRTYEKAMRYCRNGNARRAFAVLREAKDQDQPPKLTKKECQKFLDKANENHNRRVDRRTYTTAMRHCRKGDYNGALAVLRGAGNQGQQSKLSKKEWQGILERSIKTSNIQVDRRMYATAMRHCRKGDTRSAYTMLHGGGD